MGESSKAGTESKTDTDPSGRLFRVEQDLVPKKGEKQYEKQPRGIRADDLAVEHGKLAYGEEGGGEQPDLVVEPLPTDEKDEIDRSDAHQGKGQFQPEFVPAHDFAPIIKEGLHSSRMTVDFDAILDEVAETVEL